MNKTGHILVAEDDTTDAFFLQRAFRRAGIPVTLHFVQDGREALDYLQGVGRFADRNAHPLPQLVLLDIKMPRLDGFEVLEWIRQQTDFQRLEVVVFSGSDEPRYKKRAALLGANSYSVKPHSIEEMNSLVGRFKQHGFEAEKGHDQKAA